MSRPGRPRVPARRPEKRPASAPVPRSSRRWLWLAGGVVGIVVLAGGSWRAWHHFRPTQLDRLPRIDTSDLLPAVAEDIDKKYAAVVQNADFASFWGEYGLVLLAHGFRREASDCFAEAERLDGLDYRWPYYFGMTIAMWDAQASLDAFGRAVQRAPRRTSIRLRLAEWLFDLRRMDECRAELAAALSVEPDNPRAQLLQARLLLLDGRANEALPWAQRVAASPMGNRRDVLELLAQVHQRLGNDQQAQEAVERGTKLPPGVAVWDDPEMGRGAMYLKDATLLNTLADLARAQGDMDQCVNLLRTIVQTEPDNVLAIERLARTLVEDRRYDAAEYFLDGQDEAARDSAELNFLRGMVELARHDYAAARRQMELAIRLKPDYDEAFAQLALIHLALGAPESAVDAAREATRLSPASFLAHDSLGRALAAVGSHPQAVESFRRARDFAPRHGEIRQRLAESLVAMQQVEEAIRELQAAVDVVEDSAAIKKQLEHVRQQWKTNEVTGGDPKSKS